MANQRQFRVDDTAIWPYRFGNGQHGDKVWASSKTLDSSDNVFWATFVSSGTTTGTLGTSWTWTGPVLIHQSFGTGVGNWELNYIMVTSSTSASFALPLQNTYTAGAQIVTAGQFSSVTEQVGSTIGIPGWNGSTGGIGFILCNGLTTLAGTTDISQTGYRGGSGFISGNQNIQNCGEGTGGLVRQTKNSSGSEGGGGQNESQQQANDELGGAGGGNGTAGIRGTHHFNSHFGDNTGGSTSGNSDLTLMTFGGGGGVGGAFYTNSGSNPGAPGAGLFVIISKLLNVTGSFVGYGGSTNTQGNDPGGAGAGASFLLKGQIVQLGSGVVAQGGVAMQEEGPEPNPTIWGNGGDGRIHVDSLQTPTGVTQPTFTSRIDPILADPAYASVF